MRFFYGEELEEDELSTDLKSVSCLTFEGI